MNIGISGRAAIVKKFTAVVSPGTSLSLGVPVKTVTIKPVGGEIWFYGANDAEADAFPIPDGNALSLDLSFRYSSDTSIMGTVFRVGGADFPVYVIAGF